MSKKIPRVGSHLLIYRGLRAIVKRCYVEKGVWISVTVEMKTDHPPDRLHGYEYVLYPHEEGLTWARGWNTKAADTLIVKWALTS